MSNVIKATVIGIALITPLSLSADEHALDCNKCVDSSDIAGKAITNGKIGANSVSTGKITNGAVTSEKIAAGAITKSKIADNSVKGSHIRAKAITASKIAPLAVNANKIADGAVTMYKLSSELQNLLEDLQEELDRLSPDSDLTGATYCFVGLNTFLSAGNGSAEVTADPYKFKLDFTSSTEVTLTTIYDPYSTINIPAYTMTDTDDAEDPESATYTMIGNKLTVDADSVLYASPSGDVLIGGLGDRSVFGDIDHWEAGIFIGVRAASCD